MKDINTEQVMHDIEHLTQSILDKLGMHELDDVNIFVEKRFQLQKILMDYAKTDMKLRNFLLSSLQNDKEIMHRIRKEQEQLKSVLFNINNLNDYFNAGQT